MIKDMYCYYGGDTLENFNGIQTDENLNLFTKLRLSGVFLGTAIQEIAKTHYRLALESDVGDSLFSKETIQCNLQSLEQLIPLQPLFNRLSNMPFGSFTIQFTFTLAKPYISRDDDEFYICDNPVRKDKVFKIPMMPGTGWKGNLRWTAVRLFVDSLPESIEESAFMEQLEYRSRLIRLFGFENEAMAQYLDLVLAERTATGAREENIKKIKTEFKRFLEDKGYIHKGVDGRRARLNFHPTFFDRIGLEVINPHDRKTKAGTLPIYIESVPEGAKGTFSLLYVPFDLTGKPLAIVKEEVVDDLLLICRAIEEMMLTYGFSAKKSSGFGVIEDSLDSGCLTIRDMEIIKKDFSTFAELKEKTKDVSRILTQEQ